MVDELVETFLKIILIIIFQIRYLDKEAIVEGYEEWVIILLVYNQVEKKYG